ncbi:MAG TPA: branched-chain amino acid transaminase [Candidatus Dormibacteraeota bacterium]|nr:branched-chain amino acid transaminase [Candidatus Dormibacteraeota bacterium]
MPTEQGSPKWAWIDGSFVPWQECVLHVRAQAIMTGASVFEGIRAYWNAGQGQLYVFRVQEHFARLAESMKIMRMKQAVSPEMVSASIELLRRNEFRGDVHYMPVAYVGFGEEYGAQTKPVQEGFFITAVAKPQTRALEDGLSVCVSSWRRISDTVMPPRVKAAANYQNSRFALLEARTNGYDYAIFLNSSGTVSEAPGACIFVVRGNQVCTPPVTAGILESITRSTLIQLFEERIGRMVIQREIDRTELYVADEVFLCGTGMEVMPVVSIDHISVGSGRPGRLTKEIQDLYFRIARGEDMSLQHWLTPVYAPVTV